MLSTIFLVFIVFLLVMVVAANVRIVPQANVYVIERLGTYLCTWGAGLHIKVPFIDRIANKVSVKEQVVDFAPQSVITKDNVTMQIDTVVFFQVTDAKMLTYGVEFPLAAIENLTATTLRNIIGSMELDHTLTSRDHINSCITETLDKATDKWGIKVNRVEVKNIEPPKEIMAAMERQMKAERDRRAMVTEAEGTKTAQILKAEAVRESEIKKAEGMKQAAILQAEGISEAKIKVAQAEAEAVKIVASTVAQSSNPASYMISLKYIEALTKMTEGKDNKIIYMPYEASNVLGAVAAIKDLTGGVPAAK